MGLRLQLGLLSGQAPVQVELRWVGDPGSLGLNLRVFHESNKLSSEWAQDTGISAGGGGRGGLLPVSSTLA